MTRKTPRPSQKKRARLKRQAQESSKSEQQRRWEHALKLAKEGRNPYA